MSAHKRETRGLRATAIAAVLGLGLATACVQHPTMDLDDVVDAGHPWQQAVEISGIYGDSETVIQIEVATDETKTSFVELARTMAEVPVDSPGLPPHYAWKIRQSIPEPYWIPGKVGGYRVQLRAAALTDAGPLLLGTSEELGAPALCQAFERLDGGSGLSDSGALAVETACTDPATPSELVFAFKTPDWQDEADAATPLGGGGADAGAPPSDSVTASSGCGCQLVGMHSAAHAGAARLFGLGLLGSGLLGSRWRRRRRSRAAQLPA